MSTRTLLHHPNRYTNFKQTLLGCCYIVLERVLYQDKWILQILILRYKYLRYKYFFPIIIVRQRYVTYFSICHSVLIILSGLFPLYLIFSLSFTSNYLMFLLCNQQGMTELFSFLLQFNYNGYLCK